MLPRNVIGGIENWQVNCMSLSVLSKGVIWQSKVSFPTNKNWCFGSMSIIGAGRTSINKIFTKIIPFFSLLVRGPSNHAMWSAERVQAHLMNVAIVKGIKSIRLIAKYRDVGSIKNPWGPLYLKWDDAGREKYNWIVYSVNYYILKYCFAVDWLLLKLKSRKCAAFFW